MQAIIYKNLNPANLKKKKKKRKKNQLRKFHLTNLFPVLLFHLKRIKSNRKNESTSIFIYKFECHNLDRKCIEFKDRID